MHEAVLYESLPGKRVMCTACKLKCRISEGEGGVCGVRINQDGKLYLLVYGKASAVQVDPIEKKPLHHFLPGTQVFSIGTIGCNFGCTFCQNWNISQVARDLRTDLKKQKQSEKLDLEISKYGYELLPDKVLEFCLDHHLSTIAYTYNEPVIFFEYLLDCIQKAVAHGIRNVFVSNGYESLEALDLLGNDLEAMNIDLKAFTDRFYTRICKARLQPVLDTIAEVHKRGIWLEVTTLVIPGENDSDSELKDIAGFLASVDQNIPWHVSQFHPDYQMLDRSRTPRRRLERAHEIGKESGLRHVYIGNVMNGKGENTYCHSCSGLLIERCGYQVHIDKRFEMGTCKDCGTSISGIWN